MIKIPENEFEIKFVRSSGPGGQKVNKTATKAQLRWNINKSQVLAEEQKERLHRSSIIRVAKEGDVFLESEKTRSQSQNKEIVIQRFNELVNQALKKKKKRIPTKPSRAARERRLEEKRRISEIKKSRQKIKYY